MGKNKYLTNPDIIVLGLYLPGIDLLKYFHRRGLKCIGVDCEKGVPGYNLLSISTFHSPDPESDEKEWLDFIFQFGKKDTSKPLLLNTSDKFVKIIIRNAQAINDSFRFHNSTPEIVNILMNKMRLVEYSVSKGIPAPASYFYREGDNYMEELADMSFPCLIRPEFGKKWSDEPLKSLVNGNKLVEVRSRNELSDWMTKLLPNDKNLMVQERIPGPDHNLFYSVCYVDKKGIIKAYFTGQKLRLIPIHYGSASYMRTCSSEELLPLCEKLLNGSGYHGPAGIEFKKDERDGRFKIIEINTRFGLWDIMGLKSGIDLYDIAFKDLIDQEYITVTPDERKTHYWLSLSRDIPVFNLYRKEGLITTWQWLKSILSFPYYADVYLTEPGVLANLFLKKLYRKVMKGFHKYLF